MYMALEDFTLQHNGKMYNYARSTMLWKVDGEVLWSSQIPDEVKQMREKLIDIVSEGI